MSVLPVGFASASGVDTGDIGHSLRLRSAASAYLSRTFGSPSNAYGWAFSTWVKLGNLATRHTLLSGYVDANNRGYLEINDSGIIRYDDFYSGSQKCLKVSNAILRDPTSWYHIFALCNTDLATAEDRLQIYVNGVRITSWSTNTNYGLSVAPQINWASHTHYINNIGNGTFGDGYRARTCFVDSGTALTPSSFGYLNNEINEWVTKPQAEVKAVVDAGGANSVMLDFDNGTSLTTLGYDKSSKGNNWTLNNVSLTAGSTYDWMLDVPGNSFATLNPLDNTNVSNVLSSANLNITTPVGANYGPSLSSIPVSEGKWYCEFTSVSGDSSPSACRVGITKTKGINDYLGSQTGDVAYQGNGNKVVSNTASAYGSTFGTTNDVIGVAFDISAGNVEFFKNGASQGVAATGLTGTYYFAFGDATSIGGIYQWASNFGQRPFAYTPPTGYKALCQANLPDPAILNPEKHFDIRTRTGTAATYSVSDLLFQPDLAWIKSRGRAVDHALYDSVRGAQKQLESNQTGAETTETTGVTAFNSNGYTGGALDQINGTTATNSFVDWLWKAGGAAVTNNNGSISSQVSANVLAGQSVVTYTGNGTAGATVGHGLSSAPELIIHKNRNVAYDWPVWHKALLGTEYLMLNTTAAKATDTTFWNSSTPTTTTFPLGTDAKANYNQQVAYCFHSVPGYSKIGSYIGNGSADGPFVECGFKPKYVLYKRTDSTGAWGVLDAARNPTNAVNLRLYPSSNAAEETNSYMDFTATGFKIRVDSAEPTINASGGTYIFYAVADVPGKYSLAR